MDCHRSPYIPSRSSIGGGCLHRFRGRRCRVGRGRPGCGGGYRPVVSHPPNTTNGDVELVVNIGAIGVRISVTVAMVRSVAVNPSETDRIAVPAIVERSHGDAMPPASTIMEAVPGGFGRNGSWRNGRNQADKVAEQRNHGSYKQNVRPKTDLVKLTHRKWGGHEFVQIARPLSVKSRHSSASA
jgi:hypothetical protein